MAAVTLRRSGMAQFMNLEMRRFGEKLGKRVVRGIRLFAPRGETGRIVATIRATDPSVRGYHVRLTVGAHTGYSLYPEKGTGIYAGRGYIYPHTASRLVFRPKRSSRLVFARRVKGQPGQHYMEKGLIAAMRNV